LFLMFLALMWWGSRVPKRPANISAAGIFIERGSVPFKLAGLLAGRPHQYGSVPLDGREGDSEVRGHVSIV